MKEFDQSQLFESLTIARTPPQPGARCACFPCARAVCAGILKDRGVLDSSVSTPQPRPAEARVRAGPARRQAARARIQQWRRSHVGPGACAIHRAPSRARHTSTLLMDSCSFFSGKYYSCNNKLSNRYADYIYLHTGSVLTPKKRHQRVRSN